ncbi:ABC transporter substrate-binding protein [Bradyrhizobium centrosematis]|uniref:ABC transporter substrate-binding protein n=1 Tax=Bradyrhizobium centrosematis TaxID=1300039 RepID=UPI002168EAA1|nr:ABC transporter substrate-binding protein [Bradyrhizobium centrosematis]MCS3761272.1 putative ABC transport system substrate-binding protein [Bradyrhizobium centrosematis]MCS3770840.1 putative ABC transport system substrate-binding protein [Bradyrhizobium centrosematis]
MRRRHFVKLLVGGAVSWPSLARSQLLAKMKRIALVSPGTKTSAMNNGNRYFRAFFEELDRLGYVEGQNLSVERYSGEGRIKLFADLAHDVVGTRPDLIYAMSGPLALVFKAATATIPIIAISADPIALGLVPSIARPGGNITGVSVDAGIQIWGKRLGLLAEARPHLANARFLSSQALWERTSGSAAAVQEAARQAGINMLGTLLTTISEQAYKPAFRLMEQDRVDSLVVSDEPDHLPYLKAITELAANTRIPAVYPYRAFVDVGGLMAYSTDLVDVQQRCANLVYRVLKGDNPGDIPFYQQTRFELIINLKTAKALDLPMPTTLLVQADEVIE